MKLPRDGQEFANWTVIGGPPDGTYQVKFTKPDGTVTSWLTAEFVTATRIRKLVAGPSKTSPDGTATVLPLGDNGVEIRLSDTPEDVIRPGGTIEVI